MPTIYQYNDLTFVESVMTRENTFFEESVDNFYYHLDRSGKKKKEQSFFSQKAGEAQTKFGNGQGFVISKMTLKIHTIT